MLPLEESLAKTARHCIEALPFALPNASSKYLEANCLQCVAIEGNGMDFYEKNPAQKI